MSDPTNALGQAAAPQTAAQYAAASPALDLNSLVASAVTPIASQVASDVAAGLHTESLALIDGLTSRLAANEQTIQDAIAHAGGGLLANVENDPVTQRIVVCSVVGALLIGALVILVCALLGNVTANRWIGAAPAMVIGAALWVSKAGVSLPGKTAPKAPVQG